MAVRDPSLPGLETRSSSEALAPGAALLGSGSAGSSGADRPLVLPAREAVRGQVEAAEASVRPRPCRSGDSAVLSC